LAVPLKCDFVVVAVAGGTQGEEREDEERAGGKARSKKLVRA
jgi:hypothetical protein